MVIMTIIYWLLNELFKSHPIKHWNRAETLPWNVTSQMKNEFEFLGSKKNAHPTYQVWRQKKTSRSHKNSFDFHWRIAFASLFNAFLMSISRCITKISHNTSKRFICLHTVFIVLKINYSTAAVPFLCACLCFKIRFNSNIHLALEIIAVESSIPFGHTRARGQQKNERRMRARFVS